MTTVAILTIKRFTSAKQRLGDSPVRPALAEAMMVDALAALKGADAIDEVLIVSGEPEALRHGTVIDDPDEGHNPAAQRGIAAAVERGAERVLLVAGDCPLMEAETLNALLQRRGDHVAVVADRHGTGTNALVLSPPSAIAPAFGEGSCARHQALAEKAGIPCSVALRTSLALDIDTPEDLTELVGQIGPDEAPHTYELLHAEGLL